MMSLGTPACGPLFEILNLGHWDLPFDLAQGGELVEPFEIWFMVLGIFTNFILSAKTWSSGPGQS